MIERDDDAQHEETIGTSPCKHRKHNSNVDFSFQNITSSSNSKKLIRLNAIFERAADRKSGGIREDKLRRLLPSTKNEPGSERYTLLLNGGSEETTNRIISRGPFLAAFELESAAFINKLAANERADAERRKKNKAQKSRKSSTKKRGTKQKSSTASKKRDNNATDMEGRNPTSTATEGDPLRDRAHTDSTDFQSAKPKNVVEEDSDSSLGCPSPTHMRLVFQQKDMPQQSTLSKTKRKGSGKKRLKQRDSEMPTEINVVTEQKHRKPSHAGQKNMMDGMCSTQSKGCGEAKINEPISNMNNSMLRSTFAHARSDEWHKQGFEYQRSGFFGPMHPPMNSCSNSTLHSTMFANTARVGGSSTEEHANATLTEGATQKCEFFSGLMTFIGNIFAPQKQRSPVVNLGPKPYPHYASLNHFQYQVPPNSWGAVQGNQHFTPSHYNTQMVLNAPVVLNAPAQAGTNFPRVQ